MLIRFFPLLFLSGILNAQNLVPNNSFDTYSSAPDYYAEMCRATGWSSATGACVLIVGSGSPDYYNTAGSGGADPPNTWWATVTPHSGGGMAGLAPWYVTSSNFREYIRCQLSSPLVVGTTYEVSMWVTNGNSNLHGYGCNNLGVYFSSSQTNQSGGNPITSVTPQCELSSVFYNTSWQQVTFNYTATSAYQHMCIDNFHNDANTTAVLYGSGSSGAYLYIDDVVVQPSVILPIELSLFTAALNSNNTVALTWETESELSNDYFTVERSSDGERFESISQVDGHGTTAEYHKYIFTDEHPAHGSNYYRIGQTDFNGSRSYSPVRVVEVDLVKGKIELFVSPNPASSNASISVLVANDFNSPLEITMTDVSGRMVLRKNIFDRDIFNQQFQFSPGNLVNGLYFIKVLSGNTLLASEKLLIE